MKKFKPTYTDKEIEEFENYFDSSKNPVLVIGGGVLNARCVEEVREFINRTKIPVVSTLMGLGIFNKDDKEYLGMIGMHGLIEANRVVDKYDLLICVGMRFDDRIVGDKKDFHQTLKRYI